MPRFVPKGHIEQRPLEVFLDFRSNGDVWLYVGAYVAAELVAATGKLRRTEACMAPGLQTDRNGRIELEN